jgi:hypothetical protein
MGGEIFQRAQLRSDLIPYGVQKAGLHHKHLIMALDLVTVFKNDVHI